MATKPTSKPNPKGDYDDWDNQFFNAADALTIQSPKQYIVEPFFVQPSLNVVYGIAGTLKTNFLIDLAVCVALGEDWLRGRRGSGLSGYTTRQTGVTWIDVDSGRRALHERFGAMLRTRKARSSTPIQYISFPEPPFFATNRFAVQEVIKRVALSKSHLIIFDNLGTISGGKDENSSEMIQVMSSLRIISETCNAVVIVIHHDAKHETSRKSPRGHTSIEAAVNNAIWIQRDGDVVTATSTKTRDATFEPFSGLWTYQHRANTLELEEARFFGIEALPDPTTLKSYDAIIALLKASKTANQTQLIDACRHVGVGRNRAMTQIETMVRQKKIKEHTGLPHNATLYSL